MKLTGPFLFILVTLMIDAIKTTTQLWIDQLAETHALPDEVRKDLTAMVDGLQTDLHRTLVEMPQVKATNAQLGEIEGTDLDV